MKATKYKNAAKGISKVFIAELLLILSGFFTLAMSIVTAIMGNSENDALTVVILILGVVAAVIGIIAFFTQMVGLFEAGKDNSSFSVGFWIIILSIALSGLAMALRSIGGYAVAVSIIDVFTGLTNTLVMVFVVQGISTLALKSGHPVFAARGTIFNFIVFGLFVFSGVMSLLSSLMDKSNPAVQTLTGIFGVVAVVLTLVMYIGYLLYLNKARKLFNK